MRSAQKLGSYDVVVIGGGPGGIPAAIAAARSGAKTLLVEKNAFLGGMAASGLPLLAFYDRAGNRVVGGIGAEIVDRLEQEGGTLGGHIPCPIHNSFTPINPFWLRIVTMQMCGEAGVDTLYSAGVEEVLVENGYIRGAVLFSRGVHYEVECKVLIDATGDGTAAYLAGAMYEMGEGDSRKVQPLSLVFSIGNVNIDEFLAYVKANPKTFETPSTYQVHYTLDYFLDNESFYFTGFNEFIEQARANGEFDIPRDRVIFCKQPNKNEIVVNATRVINVDPTDPLQMSEAEMIAHRQVKTLFNFFKKYCPGFRDIFLANIAVGVYARESRRITGIKTLTKEYIDQLLVPEDSIALAGYNVDIHHQGVGLTLLPAEHAIGIPYGCLVSKNIGGLLTSGRCISVEPYPFGLVRAMATCFAIGEAAGTAAAMAVEKRIEPAAVNVDALRERLRNNGAIVSLDQKISAK